MDSTSSKAYFRRGQAREALGLLNASLVDLQRASELSPDDAHIKHAISKVERRLHHPSQAEELIIPLPSSCDNSDGSSGLSLYTHDQLEEWAGICDALGTFSYDLHM